MTQRVPSGLVVLAVAAGLAGPAAGKGGSEDPRERMVAHLGTQFVRAHVGNRCLAHARGTECQDAFVPLHLRPRIGLRRRARLELRFAVAPRRLYVTFEGPSRRNPRSASVVAEVRASRSDADGGRWTLRVPRRVARATYLRVHATLEGMQYVDFYVGVRLSRNAARSRART